MITQLLKDIERNNKLKTCETATKLSVYPSNVNKMFKAKNPTIKTIVKLFNVFGVTLIAEYKNKKYKLTK